MKIYHKESTALVETSFFQSGPYAERHPSHYGWESCSLHLYIPPQQCGLHKFLPSNTHSPTFSQLPIIQILFPFSKKRFEHKHQNKKLLFLCTLSAMYWASCVSDLCTAQRVLADKKRTAKTQVSDHINSSPCFETYLSQPAYYKLDSPFMSIQFPCASSDSSELPEY